MTHRLNDTTVWPFPVHEGIPLRSIINSYNPSPIPYHRFPLQLVDYLLHICQMKQLSPKSFQGTLYVTSRYLAKTNKMESIQLICLVSLMLVSKIFEYYYLSVNQIHDVSNHQFTNKDIHQMEAKILTVLDFNLFLEQVKKESPKNQRAKKYSHSITFEILLIVLEMTSTLMPKQKQCLYFQTATKVFYLYFHMLFTKDIKASLLSRLCDPRFVICVIVKVSLVILTQSNGIFPQVQWIQQMFGLKRNQDSKQYDDQFDEFTNQIMQTLLGKEFKSIKNDIKSFWIRNN